MTLRKMTLQFSLSGVCPSSGTASQQPSTAPECSLHPSAHDVAVPEDGAHSALQGHVSGK